jgi:hypothetical protein
VSSRSRVTARTRVMSMTEADTVDRCRAGGGQCPEKTRQRIPHAANRSGLQGFATHARSAALWLLILDT